MENTQTPISNPVPPQEPLVKPISPKTPILTIILAVLLILSLLGTGFLFVQNMNLQKEIASLKTDKLVPPINSPTPLPSTSSDIFSFELPEGWTVSTKQVESANPDPITVTEVAKNGWSIEFSTRKTPEFLGGQGPVDIDLNTYRTADIFGRTALITKVEDGYLPFIGGDAPEGQPRQIVVFFQRHQGETDQTFRIEDSPGNYVLLFTTNDPDNKTNISITIHSDELTEDNITSKRISKEVMDEIYQIIASAKLN